MKLTLYDLTNSRNDIRKYLVSKSKIYVNGDKLYDVVIEVDDYKSERDTLIADIAKLRAERDMYKRKLDDVVELFTRHINYKLAVSHNTWYLGLRHKLDEVLKDER
ncbi:hypothetical protein [Staphylococcus chromogenes]|uniref:hypothetical protein n=1 Tax=Staphylococcus chromogenes TaxID=46126 RepID=UPI003D799385